MKTASQGSGAAGQYCAQDEVKPSPSRVVPSPARECPLTLLLFSSLHTHGTQDEDADEAIGALQPT